MLKPAVLNVFLQVHWKEVVTEQYERPEENFRRKIRIGSIVINIPTKPIGRHYETTGQRFGNKTMAKSHILWQVWEQVEHLSEQSLPKRDFGWKHSMLFR